MAPNQANNPELHESREPTEIMYELEEALWRAGPLDAISFSVPDWSNCNHHAKRPPWAIGEARNWMRWGRGAEPSATEQLEDLVVDVGAIALKTSRVFAWDQNGSPAWIHRGIVQHEGMNYLSPELFFPVCDHVRIEVDGPVANVYEHDEWIAGGLFVDAVSPDGLRHWIDQAWGWLPELRQAVLGDRYDPARETIDQFGHLAGGDHAPANISRGDATCNG